MSAIIRRTTLRVRDMEKSLAFYENVLGMSRHYDKELTLDGRLLPGAAAGDLVRLVIMRAEHPDIGMIGLLQWLRPKKEAPPVSHDVGYGNPIFVAAVPDAEAVYRKALENNAEVRAPLSESEYPGADGLPFRVRSVGVFDPDGHFFECNQRLTD